MDHLDLVHAGSGEDPGQMLYGILGEAVADEEYAEVGLDIKFGVGIDRGVAGRDVYSDVRDRAFSARTVLSEIFFLVAFRIDVILVFSVIVLSNFA